MRPLTSGVFSVTLVALLLPVWIASCSSEGASEDPADTGAAGKGAAAGSAKGGTSGASGQGSSTQGGSGQGGAGQAGSEQGGSGQGGSGAAGGKAGAGQAGAAQGGAGSGGGASGAGGAPAPVDCGAVAQHPGWELCKQTATSCEVVFRDSAGCGAVCAALGLVCGGVLEDVDGACAGDASKPALSCGEATGHKSDHCTCVANTGPCVPSCDGKSCGPDGCGQSCGACGAGETCDGGACKAGPAEDCSKYPFSADTLLAERAGFGAKTKGGDPKSVYRVKTLADTGTGSLRAGLESGDSLWIVFDVEGKITLKSGPINVKSNKTVDGRGRKVVVEGNLRLKNVTDVIISDVGLTNELEGHCTQAGDVVTITGTGGDDPAKFSSRRIWFHHVELFNGGDGLFDIRGGTDITLSWAHLHTHKKAILAGLDSGNNPTAGMRVTFYRNHFDHITLRGPQFLYGWAHFVNNYQDQWYEYGAGSLAGARLFSETNVYEARPGDICTPLVNPCPDANPCGDNDYTVSKEALVTDWDTNGPGDTKSVGDLALNGAKLSIVNPDKVPDPKTEYTITVDEATPALAAKIKAESGPRAGYCK